MKKQLKIKVDITDHIKELFDQYEEYNDNRDDGLIIHTDCLDDFLGWLKKKNNDGRYVGLE